ncbi:MAG: HNH endonuclease domain-containing protein [Candidatus Pedobacter colombiensis]|uniref:HNH endonuclease domain-containing protein n=1 Tax=Candidatus Pedobacter colombiensis TaxID=3121371 RepID=A0AAJ6B8R3_9SPHI|nr:HNH endonuclease domain-containing protein [Pedobacter sp.]WEK21660.1 MAG: HNH endonuclease domain-containing protein [Pedobacter sp.]
MSAIFQINDPSLESQWRSLILFGKNSATYKFAFAKTLMDLICAQTTSISLTDLSVPFAGYIVEHLRANDKQGNSRSSKYLNSCRAYINNEISKDLLYRDTEKLGFVNVIDAFQNVNGGIIPQPFYEKNFSAGKKEIVITDNLLKLLDTFQYKNLDQEVEARWKLVETAWSLEVNRNLLEVQYSEVDSLLFVQDKIMNRVNITSVRDALNGYQKGKCFYSFQDISISRKDSINMCAVDHFLPHVHKRQHHTEGANINGVWNLVLADAQVNNDKRARIPERKFLQRLFNRNEFYIESKHPLAETIINQTGTTRQQRIQFLEKQYNLAAELAIHKWQPKVELPGSF